MRAKRNIEIKARATHWSGQIKKAAALAATPPVAIHQVDTFFHVPHGRLKLREFDDGTAELIQYQRPDGAGPKPSTYFRVTVAQPEQIKAALATARGIRAVVTKKRLLFLAGQTRIHMDDVSSLGRFIKLEVVLEPTQAEEQGMAAAERLMAALAIERTDLVAGAYADLLDSEPKGGARR